MPIIISMVKYVNFEDNIFVLNIRIRMVQDLLILDVDEALFLEKTLDDISFINAGLASLHYNLKKNKRLIERDEQFHNLSETEQLFCNVLNEIKNGKSNISVLNYPELKEQIGFLLDQSQGRQISINEIIENSTHSASEPVVSLDEMQELLNHG